MRIGCVWRGVYRVCVERYVELMSEEMHVEVCGGHVWRGVCRVCVERCMCNVVCFRPSPIKKS